MVSLAGREYYAELKGGRLVPERAGKEGDPNARSKVQTLQKLRADDVDGDQLAICAGDWLSSFGAAVMDVVALSAMSFHLVDSRRSTASLCSTQLRLTRTNLACKSGSELAIDLGGRWPAEEARTLDGSRTCDARPLRAGSETVLPCYDDALEAPFAQGNALRRAKALRKMYVTIGKRDLLCALRMSLNLAAERARKV
jgi:hypothetical protein